jgi:hypothetical protein
MAAVDLERVASPHLYEDEGVAWGAEQSLPRNTPFRLLRALPGLIVVAAVVATVQGLFETDPAAISGERGIALPVALAAIAAVGVGWIWRVTYRPLSAYLGVVRVHAVLTESRLLWIEELVDGSTRVRHPFRPAIVRPGDVDAIEVRSRSNGSGEIRLLGDRAVDQGTVRIEPTQSPADEVAELFARVLDVREGPRAAKARMRRARESPLTGTDLPS